MSGETTQAPREDHRPAALRLATVGYRQEETARNASKAVRNPLQSRCEPIGFFGGRDDHLQAGLTSR